MTLVYQIEKKDGERKSVYGNGTRIYVSKSAAIRVCAKENRCFGDVYKVVEYELVPTGNVFGEEG